MYTRSSRVAADGWSSGSGSLGPTDQLVPSKMYTILRLAPAALKPPSRKAFRPPRQRQSPRWETAVIARSAAEAQARARSSARQARDWATVARSQRCPSCKPRRVAAKLRHRQLFPVYGEVPDSSPSKKRWPEGPEGRRGWSYTRRGQKQHIK